MDAPHSVRFGPEARTILYEDISGAITFAFDLHRGGYGPYERWLLDLKSDAAFGRANLTEVREEDIARVRLILKRVHAFIHAQGYWLLPKP